MKEGYEYELRQRAVNYSGQPRMECYFVDRKGNEYTSEEFNKMGEEKREIKMRYLLIG